MSWRKENVKMELLIRKKKIQKGEKTRKGGEKVNIIRSLEKQILYLKCQSDVSCWKDWIKGLNFCVEF